MITINSRPCCAGTTEFLRTVPLLRISYADRISNSLPTIWLRYDVKPKTRRKSRQIITHQVPDDNTAVTLYLPSGYCTRRDFHKSAHLYTYPSTFFIAVRLSSSSLSPMVFTLDLIFRCIMTLMVIALLRPCITRVVARLQYTCGVKVDVRIAKNV